jgi:alpha-beta hydrolase superfamily lysophospholipase
MGHSLGGALATLCAAELVTVGQCKLPVSKPVLKAPAVSALEAII